MRFFRKKKPIIVVEHITGRGVRSQKVTLRQSPTKLNVYTVMLNPSECIRVTVKDF